MVVIETLTTLKVLGKSTQSYTISSKINRDRDTWRQFYDRIIAICSLFHGDGFCQITGLIYITSFLHRDVVRQQLQRNYRE